MLPLTWQDRDGGLFCDLSDAGEGAGTFLAVRPHSEPDYWRPVCVLAPGEEEREVGDGVLGREHAQDTVVKYAIQVLARTHGLSTAPREADADDPWPMRTLARLWAELASGPGASGRG
ncbi:hypothetical protein [Anaeromyxobacter oryzae]|uniref:Uncharacterized protein n=1 Tax=Anaeromyxobacter oryzae TaxID=2918170 RepID=A0ABN6MWU9_9BACT|nr:hypothetical protein [Anaeromyxobacter oryzae]BDG05390.1 hypothetical protein AMOR_43860 [Anaeromyxobacter oryzae]